MKGTVPDFVIKLYLILEVITNFMQRPEYNDYISWNGDSEIVIRNVKKLEDKVLPNFFRHKRTSSFVRQLNMYKFNKVTKLIK